jgi:hypothetical protein
MKSAFLQMALLMRAASSAAPSARHEMLNLNSLYRQELGQAQLRQHRGGLVRSLQRGLQRQDLARHLIGRHALGPIYDVLQHRLGLLLSRAGILHRVLRDGKIRLDVLDGLLPRLRGEILRDALA